MWQRGVFLLLHKINCNVFELHYSLQKVPKLQKRANKCSKTRCKNENKKLSWEIHYRYTFDSILQGSSRKRFDLYQQFGFFLSYFKVFLTFFSLNWIFSLNSATMELNTSLLNAFLAPLSTTLQGYVKQWIINDALSKSICFKRLEEIFVKKFLDLIFVRLYLLFLGNQHYVLIF